jgi:hypothetical protein
MRMRASRVRLKLKTSNKRSDPARWDGRIEENMAIVTTTLELEHKAKQIADAIILDLVHRDGFGRTWAAATDDERSAIRVAWAAKAVDVLGTLGKTGVAHAASEAECVRSDDESWPGRPGPGGP